MAKKNIKPIKILDWGEKIFFEEPIYRNLNQMHARFGETVEGKQYVEVSKFGPKPDGSGLYKQRLRIYKPQHWVKIKHIFENELFPLIGWNSKKITSELETTVKSLSKELHSKEGVLHETSKVIKDLSAKRSKLKNELAALDRIKKESNIAVIEDRLQELRKRIGKKLPETKGSNSWQSWVYNNNWLFGVNYLPPLEKERIGFDNIPDYLFPTIDGFLDILDIKLPSHDVIVEDTDHRGSYRWSSEANSAIGQVVNYLHSIELHQEHISNRIRREHNIVVSLVKPRGFILIGNTNGWGDVKKEALRKLNYSLHGIEVLTYSDLEKRGNEIIQIYNKDLNGGVKN